MPPKTIKTRQQAKDNGYMYFWGSECQKGHDGLRYVSGHCVECNRAKAAKQDKKAYRCSPLGMATIKKYNAAYYDLNRDQELVRVKKYQKENKDQVRKAAKQYREKNKEQRSAKIKEWRKKNPKRCRSHEAKRRMRESSGDGFTDAQIKSMLVKQKFKCVNCKKDITDDYHIDHIMPLFLGGENDIKNIQILCPGCNLSKHKKDPIEWAQQNGRLL